MDLELQGTGLEGVQTGVLREGLDQGLESIELNPRSKTSLRMHYEAQVSVIQKQTGNLEEIRASLGLSQRKMAQLLLVDPSSWTRWTKNKDEAPPHIWRSLQWYMALREKIPGLTPAYFLGSNPQVLHQKALQEVENEKSARIEMVKSEKQALQMQMDALKKDLNFHRKMSIVILFSSLCWALALGLWKVL